MSGWYLRGDVGFRWNSGGVSSNNVTSEKYTTSFDGTAGFGWKYQWEGNLILGAELNYSRFLSSGLGSSTDSMTRQLATTPQAPAQHHYFYTAKISSQAVLANGYIDFGTWANLTPYIGAGAGIARLKSVDYVDTTDSPTQPNNATGVTSRGSQQNFAWAAMAGVSYQVAQNWMIDVGYRYLSMDCADAECFRPRRI